MKLYVIAFWRLPKATGEVLRRWDYIMPPAPGWEDKDPLCWGPSNHIGNAMTFTKRKDAVAIKKRIVAALKIASKGIRQAVGKPEIIEVGGKARKFYAKAKA